MAKVQQSSAYRLVWKSEEFQELFEEVASETMTDLMLDAEKASRSRLYPGHGVDTGTMRNRTHIAAQGHNWSGEHIDPVDGGGPDLGGKRVAPKRQSGGRAHGALVLELGCGQEYTIFYHQHQDAFIRIPWERANKLLLGAIDEAWAKAERALR